MKSTFNAFVGYAILIASVGLGCRSPVTSSIVRQRSDDPSAKSEVAVEEVGNRGRNAEVAPVAKSVLASSQDHHFGKPGPGKFMVIMLGDIYGLVWIDEDETLLSLWSKVGPGERCAVCGSTPSRVRVRYVGENQSVSPVYSLRRMSPEDMNLIPIKEGARIEFFSAHW